MAAEQGDPDAGDKLLPLVYEELRKLASNRLAQEKPGRSLRTNPNWSGIYRWPTDNGD